MLVKDRRDLKGFMKIDIGIKGNSFVQFRGKTVWIYTLGIWAQRYSMGNCLPTTRAKLCSNPSKTAIN